MKSMTGVIIEARRKSEILDPHSYYIQGDDGEIYFAHIADTEDNVQKLYKNLNIPTVYLKEGERVEFDIPDEPKKRVIHLKALKN